MDDEDAVREMVCEILQKDGFSVIPARDAEEALAECDRHPGPISLAVSDLSLPGRSGLHLAAELARRRPGLKTLFISGDTGNEIPEGAQFLPKPFTPRALRLKVRELLGDVK